MTAAGERPVAYFPRGVLDPLCPDEHIITETTDRRILWNLEMVLSGLAGTAARDAVRNLRIYLHQTCAHHWHDYEGDLLPPEAGGIPAHRQCLWCHDVEWAGAA